MLNLNNVYNYYSTQLVSFKGNGRFRSHEIDDLKAVYRNMIKQNQISPLYKFSFSDTAQMYAISIKEAALALEAESQSLGNEKESVFEEMSAVSTNENVAYANLNNNDTKGLPDKISIQVDSLATCQTNVGNYLSSGESSFLPGDYSFDISVGHHQYSFSLSIREGDTNEQIQKSLATSINANHIGIHAGIRHNRIEGTSALVLRSSDTGVPEDGDLFFHFNETHLENDLSTILGMDNVESAPSNASFYINDDLHTAISNRISLNHSLDIDLLSTSDSPVTVYLVPDEKKISDKLEDFLHSYNQLVDISKSGANNKGGSRLFRDITSITRHNMDLLSTAGLTVDENGYLQHSGEAETAQIKELFNGTSTFRQDIKRITGKMSLNPLDYIDKIVITYPNTNGTYPNPYQPSKYSGLLFNDYA